MPGNGRIPFPVRLRPEPVDINQSPREIDIPDP